MKPKVGNSAKNKLKPLIKFLFTPKLSKEQSPKLIIHAVINIWLKDTIAGEYQILVNSLIKRVWTTGWPSQYMPLFI